MRYLNADDVRAALSHRVAIDAMRAAFGPDREYPPRVSIGSSLFMPGRIGTTTGIKVVSTVPGNPVGLVAVFGVDGSPLGIVDGPTLTAIRTAAGSGLATDLLAAHDAHTLAMLGAGAMAFDQIEAMRAVRSIDTVVVWSRTRARAEQLAERIGGQAVRDAANAVARADIIVTATPAIAPLFPFDAVRHGAHINAVGAHTPEMVELPAELVRKAYVVVDDRTPAAVEAGDLIQAGATPDADMEEVLAGTARPGDQAYTIFKSVGVASQDVAAARVALEVAEMSGIGVVLD